MVGTERNWHKYKSICYFSTSDITMDLSIHSTVKYFKAMVGAIDSNLPKSQSNKGSMS